MVERKEATPVEVKRFSDEANEALQKEGYRIYKLTGQSIGSLREAGRKFWPGWLDDFPDVEAIESMHSEIAIIPDQIVLPHSDCMTLDQQVDLVTKFSIDVLSQKIKGVAAIIGDASDYVDLAFTYLDETGDYLFGEEDGYIYARTTSMVGPCVLNVGVFRVDIGLHVGPSYGDASCAIFASPLVVPKS